MKRLKLICAALALCLILPAFSSCVTLVDRLPESENSSSVSRPAETDPSYSPLDNSDIKFLTARDFSSDRTAGEVSKEFRAAAADFALKLINESREYAEGDGLLVSPLSVMLALAMTANGAQGETLLEMEKVLGGMTIDELNAQLFNYTSGLVSTPDAKFNLANAIWVTSDDTFSVNGNFLKAVENTYDADIVAAKLDTQETLDAINTWVDEQTFGMIKKIYDKPLDPSTVMVLLNALAFDALWADQPTDYSCHNNAFKNADGSSSDVKFMWANCDGYIEGKNEVGIVKNYMGGHYAFVALLPDEGTSIADYMASLDGAAFLELFDKREKAAYDVSVTGRIPFFGFDCTVNLNETLAAMGMPRAFDPTSAQFGALGVSALGNIFINRVLHKTHIDLDNSGTRAAAVTAIEMATESAGPVTMKNYRVELDRPFVYAIVDTNTGLPIFIGSCENIADQAD